jgi:DNA-binding transcriptional regulator YiaG
MVESCSSERRYATRLDLWFPMTGFRLRIATSEGLIWVGSGSRRLVVRMAATAAKQSFVSAAGSGIQRLLQASGTLLSAADSTGRCNTLCESPHAGYQREVRISGRARALRGDLEQHTAPSLRFPASGLASHRNRLGLSAADFGKLLGVSGQSVYKSETGEVKPHRAQLEAIAAVRKMGRREALAVLAQAE